MAQGRVCVRDRLVARRSDRAPCSDLKPRTATTAHQSTGKMRGGCLLAVGARRARGSNKFSSVRRTGTPEHRRSARSQHPQRTHTARRYSTFFQSKTKNSAHHAHGTRRTPASTPANPRTTLPLTTSPVLATGQLGTTRPVSQPRAAAHASGTPARAWPRAHHRSARVGMSTCGPEQAIEAACRGHEGPCGIYLCVDGCVEVMCGKRSDPSALCIFFAGGCGRRCDSPV